MNDDDLKQAFNSSPEPDINAKKRAVNLAMAEFRATQREYKADNLAESEKKSDFFQGFLNWWRPMGDNNPSRNSTMKNAQKKLIISGMATSSLIIAGVFLFSQFPQPINDLSDTQVISERRLAEAQLSNVTNQDKSIQTEIEPARQSDSLELADSAEEIVVTGIRASLEAAVDAKRDSAGVVDTISAEDIGKFPDTNLAESMQRVSGVSIAESKGNIGRAETVSKVRAFEAPMPIAASPSPSLSVDVLPAQADKEYRNRFEEFEENSVNSVAANPVSTFSIDVDTASYSFVRRNLNSGQLPPKDSIRIEEMVNYFDYSYPLPASKKVPFEPTVAVVDSPWKTGNKLIHIGIKGYQIPASETPRSNLVFLLDVSGSMSSPDKLPLVQQSMEMLLDKLKPDDTVAIVIYAGAAGKVLDPTPAREKQKILTAIKQLHAGGSTAGAEGIQLAYQLAEANFDKQAVNRIILATDGDFNVGPTGDSDLKTLVERKRDKGIYLSVLGFGSGNYQDEMMQTLAQSGNGIAAYIDTLSEAQKVLVHEATSTLFPIANDVKIQVEFNPATVAEYRLIGYETRALKREDFANDKVDAGDIGAGHTVTAIYEITPVGEVGLFEPSRYQQDKTVTNQSADNEYAFLRIRYKLPGEKASQLIEQPISLKQQLSLEKTIVGDSLQQEVGFATAVAGFSQLLRGSNFVGGYDYDQVLALAQKTKGADDYGYRTEFIQLVRKAKLAKAL